MIRRKVILVAALMAMVSVTAARAECQIADAKLEEAIQQNPRFRGPANSQYVHDLRSLRDAAMTLRSYGRHEDCERLLANIRELIAGPPMGSLGGNDEEDAEKQMAASEQWQGGKLPFLRFASLWPRKPRWSIYFWKGNWNDVLVECSRGTLDKPARLPMFLAGEGQFEINIPRRT